MYKNTSRHCEWYITKPPLHWLLLWNYQHRVKKSYHSMSFLLKISTEANHLGYYHMGDVILTSLILIVTLVFHPLTMCARIQDSLLRSGLWVAWNVWSITARVVIIHWNMHIYCILEHVVAMVTMFSHKVDRLTNTSWSQNI